MGAVLSRRVSTRAIQVAEWSMMAILLLVSLMVGMRDSGTGVDTKNYLFHYEKIQDCECLLDYEFGFEALTWAVAMAGVSPQGYLVFLSLMQMILLWVVGGKIAGPNAGESNKLKVRATVIIFFLLSPLFLSAQINAIRQGTAAIGILFAVSGLYEQNYRQFALWCLVSVSVHYSSVLYLLALSLLALPAFVAYAAFSASFLLYVTGVSEKVIEWLSGAANLGVYELIKLYGITADYRGGVRLDFAAASLAFLLVGLLLRGLAPVMLRPRVDYYLRVYTCLMLPFLWLGWAAFSNRYAYSPWLVMSCVVGIGMFPRVRKLAPGVFATGVAIAGVIYSGRFFGVI